MSFGASKTRRAPIALFVYVTFEEAGWPAALPTSTADSV
jgi:hypothetical protein